MHATHVFVLIAAALSVTFAESSFELIRSLDPFTDENSSTLSVESESEDYVGLLVWSCVSDSEYVLIVGSDDIFVSGDWVRVAYRFDDANAVSGRWPKGPMNRTAVALDGLSDRFTDGAVDAESVLVGITDDLGIRLLFRFRLDGLRRHLHELGCVLEVGPIVPAPRVPIAASIAPTLAPIAPGPAPLAGEPEARIATEPPEQPRPGPPPRPLAVILDNELGYPQAGLPQASWIAEMPVEGGATRLMAFFDAGEPARVGPIRGARDYFVELAARADAVVVHDGGSPSALIALEQGVAPSLNADRRGDLFARAADRSAPYDLYSAGSALRDAIGEIRIDVERLLTALDPIPPANEAPRVNGVSIDWSGAYDSGFRYVAAQDRYRWIRNGDDAVSSSNTAVQVEAVLIARIRARPIPNDATGRLDIPVAVGDAQLLWRGAVIEGTWSAYGGFRFTDADGNRLSLETLVTWVAFVPQDVTVDLR